MSWWQKLFGIEEAEQDLQEHHQFIAQIQQSNIEIAKAIAEQYSIPMAQCSSCQAWYIESRGPWCGCQ